MLRAPVGPFVMGMAVSADGHWIASSSDSDDRLVLWSTQDPRAPAHMLAVPGFRTLDRVQPRRSLDGRQKPGPGTHQPLEPARPRQASAGVGSGRMERRPHLAFQPRQPLARQRHLWRPAVTSGSVGRLRRHARAGATAPLPAEKPGSRARVQRRWQAVGDRCS